MSSNGIRDQVAIVGMGCTKFGELWNKGIDDLDRRGDRGCHVGRNVDIRP
jgi:acetyl-CoA C-acetyltransferase